jgi:hypothetical protein
MSNLLKFAEEGNADQCFAIIKSEYQDNPTLQRFSLKYENGLFNDREFCEVVYEYMPI